MPLVLAATPIGDYEDASPRLCRLLETADVIAAEDTRRVRRLASGLGLTLSGRLVAVYDAAERSRSAELLDAVAAGRTVVVVSDAGMPLVSDPGYVLVAGAVERGLPVTVVPGPSAVTAALAVSGLAVERFCFDGFLPRKSGERKARLAELAGDSRAVVFFESPRRLATSLADAVAAFGAGRRAAVCRELTKTHEEVRRATLAELAAWAASRDVLGEVTVVVEGGTPTLAEVDDAALRDEVESQITAGMTRRDAVDAVAAKHGLARRRVYSVALHE
ncbi:MAG TPA: 16S rRNA (cytidine(1402)-2'-O)-methyltransferase [Mycobacteriales bacterium]|nr:16S rRNA (cytidine(1402)-2'-O)-methyltransferase [Mycobacteriales bacterium]